MTRAEVMSWELDTSYLAWKLESLPPELLTLEPLELGRLETLPYEPLESFYN
jgi:hypothetical protein